MTKIRKLLISSLILVGSSNLMAIDNSVTNIQAALLKNNKDIAHITILTPVEVLKKSPNFTTIKIKGFRQESYPQMVVRDMKRGELYVEFDENKEDLALKSFKVLKSYEDDYGEVWQEVEGTFQIKSSALTSKVQKLNKKAQTTYEKTCSMCHRLHEPHDFTVNQWPHLIQSMEDQAPIEPLAKQLIIKYLQHNAKDSK